MKVTGYNQSRKWFCFSFENSDIISPHDGILFFWIVEQFNKLGWKKRIGLPTSLAMEATGIKNHRTYKKSFENLIEWGFIRLVSKSKNQHTANIIALVENTKAESKALDTALLNHDNSSVDIVKPQTIKPINNKKISEIEISEVPYEEKELFKYGIDLHEVILKNANQKNVPLKKVENATYWYWINPLRLMFDKDNVTVNHLKKIIEYLRNPDHEFWRKTILDTKGLRKNSSKILTEINSSSKLPIGKVPTDDSLTSKLESYE